MAVSNPTQFVSVPFEELKNLMEMARGVAKRSPFGTVDTQPWNPDMTVLPELGNSLPTIAGGLATSLCVADPRAAGVAFGRTAAQSHFRAQRLLQSQRLVVGPLGGVHNSLLVLALAYSLRDRARHHLLCRFPVLLPALPT